MNLFEKNIREITQEIVDKNNLFLIDLIIRGNINNRIIEIYIDSEKTISADDCADISRQINSVIEDRGIIESSYRLDVSSPGVDRPLKYLQQFPKHIGRKFEISYESNDSTKKLAAKLIRVEGELLVFSYNNNEVIINFNNIKKAKVIISFS